MADVRPRLWKRLLGSPLFWGPAVCAVVAGGLGYLPVAIVAGTTAIGILLVRVAFGFEQLKNEAEVEIAKGARQALEEQLDQLANRLRADRDYRTKDALTLARDSIREFETYASQSDLKYQTLEIGRQMQDLFQATTELLEHSLQLFEQADRLVGDQRQAILDQREASVAQSLQAAEKLQGAAKHFRELVQSSRDADVQPLQDELDTSLRIARRTEERMRELENSTDPLRRMEE